MLIEFYFHINAFPFNVAVTGGGISDTLCYSPALTPPPCT